MKIDPRWLRKESPEVWAFTHHPHYWVSNRGRVRSLMRGDRMLKPGLTAQGYPSVVFGRKGGTQLVHRLVARAFLGPVPEGQEVRHKDDNRANAAAYNLEYGTRRQNIQDMIDRGRQNIPRGEAKGAHVKLSGDKVRALRARRGEGVSFRKLAKEFGVGATTVRSALGGRSWTHV